MSKYVEYPKNNEVENKDFVVRVAIKNLHCSGGKINPELFLLRKRKNKTDETALSVVVEKELNSSESIRQAAIESVPPPPNNPNVERTALRLNAGELRQLLIGVTHTPGNNKAHGSLHGYFSLQKADSIVKASKELVAVEANNK